MAIYRRAAKRDENEDEIVTALRTVGATVSPLSGKGIPDLLVGYHGRTILMEVKMPKKKLTEDQVKWHRAWTGAPVYIIRSVQDAMNALEVFHE